MQSNPKTSSDFPHMLRDLASATVFLTRLPLPQSLCHDTSDAWRTTTWAYPVVGILIGGFTGGMVLGGMILGLSAPLSALLAVSLSLVMTGALHEDGLADTADGFGGGKDRDRKLAIMKDSHIGTYGVLALITMVGMKAAALWDLAHTQHIMMPVVLCAVLSRAAMLIPIATLPSARAGGLADGMVTVGRTEMIKASGVVGLCLVLACGTMGFWPTVLTLGTMGLATLGITRLMRQHVGGFTGDTIGTTQLTSEVVGLITLSILL